MSLQFIIHSFYGRADIESEIDCLEYPVLWPNSINYSAIKMKNGYSEKRS